MRSRQPKRRIIPQSFDNSRDEFLYSTGCLRAHHYILGLLELIDSQLLENMLHMRLYLRYMLFV